jgi:hypothetical protein
MYPVFRCIYPHASPHEDCIYPHASPHEDSTFNFLRNCYTISTAAIYRLVEFFFFVTVLEFELRALCLLGRCSTAWATPPALFCFSYLIDRSSPFLPGPTLDAILLSASPVAGITGVWPGFFTFHGKVGIFSTMLSTPRFPQLRQMKLVINPSWTLHAQDTDNEKWKSLILSQEDLALPTGLWQSVLPYISWPEITFAALPFLHRVPNTCMNWAMSPGVSRMQTNAFGINVPPSTGWSEQETMDKILLSNNLLVHQRNFWNKRVTWCIVDRQLKTSKRTLALFLLQWKKICSEMTYKTRALFMKVSYRLLEEPHTRMYTPHMRTYTHTPHMPHTPHVHTHRGMSSQADVSITDGSESLCSLIPLHGGHLKNFCKTKNL